MMARRGLLPILLVLLLIPGAVVRTQGGLDKSLFLSVLDEAGKPVKDIVADEEAFVDRPNTFRWLLDDHFSWGPKEPGKVLVPRPWKSERRPDGNYDLRRVLALLRDAELAK